MSHIAMIDEEHNYVCENCNKETILESAIMYIYHEDNNFIRQYFARCECGQCGIKEILQIDHEGYEILEEVYFSL